MTKNKQNTKKPVNTQCIGDNADLCANAELVRNGGPIDWRYWSARREITPQEAAKLAHCIDPIQWPDDQHAQGPILNDLHIKIQRLAALLAERNQKWTLIDLAAMLGNNAPLFMREIANLAQQAGDRCNAGIKVSKAPPPITPIRGGGYVAKRAVVVQRKPATAPDWAYWPAARPVKPWQAVALSLNLEPESLEHSSTAWMAGPGAGPVLKSESFPDAETEATFGKRLALLGDFVSHSSSVPLGVLAGKLVAHTMPPEMAALIVVPAVAVASAETTDDLTDGKVGTNKKTWDDAKLRALWEESILPNVTNASLAKKHRVTRQRIGALIKQAKAKFSASGRATSSTYGRLIVHKMED